MGGAGDGSGIGEGDGSGTGGSGMVGGISFMRPRARARAGESWSPGRFEARRAGDSPEHATEGAFMPDDEVREEGSEQARQEDGQREQGVRTEDSEDLSSPQFTRRADDGERAASSPGTREGADRPR